MKKFVNWLLTPFYIMWGIAIFWFYYYSIGEWRRAMRQKDISELIDKELNSHGPKIQYKTVHVIPKDMKRNETYTLGNDHA